MFIYNGQDNQMCSFTAADNMTCYVAYLYQSKFLRRSLITSNKFSKTLNVKLLNPNEYKFKEGCKYHLILRKYTDRLMKIVLSMNSKDYVANHFKIAKAKLSSVTNVTWKELFNKNIDRPVLTNEYKEDYQNDYYEYLLEDYKIKQWEKRNGKKWEDKDAELYEESSEEELEEPHSIEIEE